MKLKTELLLLLTLPLLLLLILPLPSPAMTGGFVDNGADYAMEEGSWFTAGGPVRWCFHREVKTELEPRFMAGEAQAAFAKWEDFVRHTKPFAENAPGFELKFQFTGVCNGDEDITIYFGHQTPEILKEKAKYQNPFSFAKRTAYDVKTGRGKGYIWVNGEPAAPVRWSTFGSLRGVLLHEIGHILGCEHVEGTIMTSRLRDFLMKNTGVIKGENDYEGASTRVALTAINFTKELFFNATDGIAIWGFRGPATAVEKEVFRNLIGREPEGPVSLGVVQGYEGKNKNANFYLMEVNKNRELDENGHYKFQKWVLKMELDPILHMVPISEARVFKVQKPDGGLSYKRVEGYTRTGFIIKPDGSTVDILYYRNQATDSPIQIYYKVRDHFEELLRASPLQALGNQEIFK